MVNRDFLLFEIGFYESKIAHFRDLIARYEKNVSDVRGELCHLTTDPNPSADMDLSDAHTGINTGYIRNEFWPED